jgi:spore germination protein KA
MSKKEKLKNEIIKDKVKKLNNPLNDVFLSSSLKENIKIIKAVFIDNDILIIREVDNNNDDKLHYALAYCDGLVNASIINENIIKPLILSASVNKDNLSIQVILKNVLLANEVKETNKMKDIVEDITYGDVILFIDGLNEVLIINTKLFEKRAITEPENEKALLGPREGFTEVLLTNLSLISRKLRTNDLKFKAMTLGDKTNTECFICYIDSIVNKNALEELKKRLSKIKIDGVLDTNYISELTRENPFSPFRTTGYTEKPDVVIGKLLEGRIALILDGTPIVLTIPYLFIENFQNSEDYYLSFFYTSFSRIIRMLGFFLTIAVPAFYIAIVAYHKEMLPTQLFISIAIERENVPLPAAIEAFVMLIVFDIIRETGIRMPSNIGQALSILGATVIGQALVAAKLVAAPMIIVVAFTGVTGLLIPKLNAPIIVIRIMLLILASTLGLYGLVFGLAVLLIHILNLKSFGVSQTPNVGEYKFQSFKDSIFRAPWWTMIKRSKTLTNNHTRLAQTGVKFK